ncbi:NADH-quinone oxidoreductase subunit L [Alsobacter sp. SYSU M60028]|uniref:NADH-quinone oxidoreductase subunit L n=1 Tax=Alsobacter ponti TaxID=2962936 RepID=A0ABT1LC11_9HYPH|nr:NADH-quinone oxidoreductase subunit L [Alsobacter ponti]MCP8938285.1 NADH-quinone oxidoreductase subunit L [Alsobacter ponti]
MYKAIVFLPLIGFFIAGLFGRYIGARASEVVTTALLMAAAALSWFAFFAVGYGHQVEHVQVMRWMSSGGLVVDWAFRIDTLTAVMLIVVNTVSSLVHLYSIGYMNEDPDRPRFFAYLSLFTFAMLMLVTADNLVQMFFGWEGVGLASYLLIGFWYQKPSAVAAAMKAFIVNRVGDFGFALGIFLVFVLFGSVAFADIFPKAEEVAKTTFHFIGYDWNAITIACLLLFMGAMGKSAQFLLHTWLPDAMEGPTPVSALIHAATMVTAGVFMVARLSPLFELSPVAMGAVLVVGATTAFFAGTVGLVQNDIKRVIAYSTCSQLGYMFVALGAGAFGAGIFHLFTHAFFKALLFLGAGSVIHAMHHEQDIRHMGGLARKIPFTTAMMAIGTLALTGFPLTAGYFSKDAIIESAYATHVFGNSYGFILLVITAGLTSFYSWRLFFLTFMGQPRWDTAHGHDPHVHHAQAEDDTHGSHAHGDDAGDAHDAHGHGHGAHEPHESPLTMLVPLAVLALGALAAGLAFNGAFLGHDAEHFWNGALVLPEHEEHPPVWVVWAPTVAMVIGFAVSWLFYIKAPHLPRALAESQPGLYKFLLNKWYFDELYDVIFVRTAKWIGRFLWKKGDGAVIDGMGPDGVSARVVDITQAVVRLQTGYVYHYAFAMLIGVAALVTWYMLGGAH